MRYAAVSQSRSDAPVHVIGIGETMDDALASARAWFDLQFARVGYKEHPHLLSLQHHLCIFDEHDLESKSGMGLDAWLARMRAVGVIPPHVKAKPTLPVDNSIWADPAIIPTPRKRGIGLDTWVIAALLFLVLPGFEIWWVMSKLIPDGIPVTTNDWVQLIGFSVFASAATAAALFIVLKLVFGLSLQTFVLVCLGLRILASGVFLQTGFYERLDQIQTTMNDFNATIATMEAYQASDGQFGGGYPIGSGFDDQELADAVATFQTGMDFTDYDN